MLSFTEQLYGGVYTGTAREGQGANAQIKLFRLVVSIKLLQFLFRVSRLSIKGLFTSRNLTTES